MWYTSDMKIYKKVGYIIACFLSLLGLFAISVFCVSNNHCNFVSYAVSEDENNFSNLIVFIRFSDEEDYLQMKAFENQTIRQVTNNNYSQADYCVEDYFYTVSNGKVKMKSFYLCDKDGLAIQLSNPRGYYVKYSQDNPEGYEESDRSARMLELKQDWANAIKSAITNGGKILDYDGNEYLVSELDKNGDNLVDSLTIIFNYSSEFAVNGSSDVLWNYQDFYNGVELVANGKTITSGNYVQLTANYSELYHDKNGVVFSNLKTMVHEMGHVFGLKDLYKKDLTSPVYFMSAMAKDIGPVPQFISAKEREAMGWLDENNIQLIGDAGTYTIKPTSGLEENNIICYKLNIPSLNKILYLEYRKFEGIENKYDTKDKQLTNSSGESIESENNLKSGLVCYLFTKGMKYPDNYSNSTINFEVIGGGTTKNDSALTAGESYNVSLDLKIEVKSVNDDSLTFDVVGTDIEHVHTIILVPQKSATCKEVGNDEYWKCSVCGKCFDDENLIYEKNESEFIISKKAHTKQWVNEVPATCKKEGSTAGEKCEICGEVISGCSIIPVTDHRSSDWIIDKESTTTENGVKHKECLDCGDVLEISFIDMKQEETEKDDNNSTGNENNASNPKDDVGDNDVDSKPNEKEQIKNIGLTALITVLSVSVLGAVVSIFFILRKRK